MFTIKDLADQVDVQGYVVVKCIHENGDVDDVVGGGIESVFYNPYKKYADMEIMYMYADSEDGLCIEVKDY